MIFVLSGLHMGLFLPCGPQEEYEVEQRRKQQAYREAQHDAIQPHAADESYYICGGYAHYYITHECDIEHGHDVRSAAQGVGESYLGGVAELV